MIIASVDEVWGVGGLTVLGDSIGLGVIDIVVIAVNRLAPPMLAPPEVITGMLQIKLVLMH